MVGTWLEHAGCLRGAIMMWVTKAVHHIYVDATRVPRVEMSWWSVQRVGEERGHHAGEEGIDWVRGWEGPQVDAFKAMLALRPT